MKWFRRKKNGEKGEQVTKNLSPRIRELADIFEQPLDEEQALETAVAIDVLMENLMRVSDQDRPFAALLILAVVSTVIDPKVLEDHVTTCEASNPDLEDDHHLRAHAQMLSLARFVRSVQTPLQSGTM